MQPLFDAVCGYICTAIALSDASKDVDFDLSLEEAEQQRREAEDEGLGPYRYACPMPIICCFHSLTD